MSKFLAVSKARRRVTRAVAVIFVTASLRGLAQDRNKLKFVKLSDIREREREGGSERE